MVRKLRSLLGWLRYFQRLEDIMITNKMRKWKPVGRRKIEKPRTRWIDNVEDDLSKCKMIEEKYTGESEMERNSQIGNNQSGVIRSRKEEDGNC